MLVVGVAEIMPSLLNRRGLQKNAKCICSGGSTPYGQSSFPSSSPSAKTGTQSRGREASVASTWSLWPQRSLESLALLRAITPTLQHEHVRSLRKAPTLHKYDPSFCARCVSRLFRAARSWGNKDRSACLGLPLPSEDCSCWKKNYFFLRKMPEQADVRTW